MMCILYFFLNLYYTFPSCCPATVSMDGVKTDAAASCLTLDYYSMSSLYIEHYKHQVEKKKNETGKISY